MVFAEDVGIEIVDSCQRYCVIYINKTIQESACTFCRQDEQRLFVCSKKSSPFGFLHFCPVYIVTKDNGRSASGLLGHLSISVFITVVQISCWAWVWGGAFETNGRVAGTWEGTIASLMEY